MVTARGAGIDPLLDRRPRSAEGEKEVVVVELKTVLDRIVVDLRGQTAQVYQIIGSRLQGELFTGRDDLRRCFARGCAFTAGHDQSQFFFESTQSLFQRAADRGRDAGGVPVETKNAA